MAFVSLNGLETGIQGGVTLSGCDVARSTLPEPPSYHSARRLLAERANRLDQIRVRACCSRPTPPMTLKTSVGRTGQEGRSEIAGERLSWVVARLNISRRCLGDVAAMQRGPRPPARIQLRTGALRWTRNWLVERVDTHPYFGDNGFETHTFICIRCGNSKTYTMDPRIAANSLAKINT